MALNENIKNARKKNNMTQRQLADAIGVSHNTISDWESGNHKPDIDTLFLLCKVLSVDANYMLDYEEKIKELKSQNKLNDDQYKQILKNKGLMDNNENISEEDFKKLIDFAVANKDFIIKKDKD